MFSLEKKNFIYWLELKKIIIMQLDLAKAFDTVDQAAIMEKLLEIQLEDEVFNWLCNFLSNRKHCTKWNHVISESSMINSGVVQGLVLGPTLFLFAISDLKPLKPDNNYVKYANDTGYIPK